MQFFIYTEDGEIELEEVAVEVEEALEVAVPNDTKEILFDGIYEIAAELEAGRTYRDFLLASAKGVPEFKTVMERQCRGSGWRRFCWPMIVMYSRSADYKVYARVSTGKITNDMVWDTVRGCVMEAAVSAGIAGILASNISLGAGGLAAAKGAFSLTLQRCLSAKGGEFVRIARDIRLSLFTEKTSGSWKRRS